MGEVVMDSRPTRDNFVPTPLPRVRIEGDTRIMVNAKIPELDRSTFDENVRASKNGNTYQSFEVPSQRLHKVDDAYIVEELPDGNLYTMDTNYWNAAKAFDIQTRRVSSYNKVVQRVEELKEAVQAAHNAGVVTINNTRLGQISTQVDSVLTDLSSVKPV